MGGSGVSGLEDPPRRVDGVLRRHKTCRCSYSCRHNYSCYYNCHYGYSPLLLLHYSAIRSVVRAAMGLDAGHSVCFRALTDSVEPFGARLNALHASTATTDQQYPMRLRVLSIPHLSQRQGYLLPFCEPTGMNHASNSWEW
jgi:hypothetical protein